LFAILLVMQLFLIRHGQDLNPDQNRLTDTDPLLSTLGEEQAVSCAIKIKNTLGSGAKPIIIASPRARTMQTARVVAMQLGVEPEDVKSDTRLKERDCAAYSGQLAGEVFSNTEEDLVAGGMEPYSNLLDRLGKFYEDILIRTDSPIIIVTHSGNIKPFMKLSRIDHPYSLEADTFLRLI